MPYDSKGNFMTWDQLDAAIVHANESNIKKGLPSWDVKTSIVAPTVSNPVHTRVVDPTPTRVTPVNPLNQKQYLTNLANGYDEFGNPTSTGNQIWAKNQLEQLNTSTVVPTPQQSKPVQGATNPNDILPSTGGVGGMMDKVAPVFVLLILVKILSGVGGLFKK